jgi:CRISPR-associated endonuclease Cas2
MIRMVMYDIEEDKPRTKLAHYLEHHGLLRLQYSVFAGEVGQHRWKAITAYLGQYHLQLCQPGDRIYAMTMDVDMFKKMEVFGDPPDIDYMLNSISTLFI